MEQIQRTKNPKLVEARWPGRPAYWPDDVVWQSPSAKAQGVNACVKDTNTTCCRANRKNFFGRDRAARKGTR